MVQIGKKDLFKLVASGNGLYVPFEGREPFCSKSTAAVLKHRHKKGTLGNDTYDEIACHFGFSKETIYTKI